MRFWWYNVYRQPKTSEKVRAHNPVSGTPGRELLDKGVCTIDGKVRKVKALYEHFDFSSHCGASQLKDALRKLGGKPKVFVVHGDEGNCELFANWAKSELGLDAVAPKTGDTFEV